MTFVLLLSSMVIMILWCLIPGLLSTIVSFRKAKKKKKKKRRRKEVQSSPYTNKMAEFTAIKRATLNSTSRTVEELSH